MQNKLKVNIELYLIFLKKNKLIVSAVTAGFITLLILIHVISHHGTDRRVFYFPVSGSAKTQKEIRYLKSNPVQGEIQYYIDELVLGPSVYRSRPLFSSGTKVNYCFLRNKILYIELSKEAVLQEDESVNIQKAVSLLKKNIKKNFGGIKNIEIFIDGNFIND
ncbi:GerMN domain-containing protein [Treponema sp.]|uniref:GerMN domain-containing protein n=1 Tax=Treponema sp. TaxID=166 RepID=UPI0038900C73